MTTEVTTPIALNAKTVQESLGIDGDILKIKKDDFEREILKRGLDINSTNSTTAYFTKLAEENFSKRELSLLLALNTIALIKARGMYEVEKTDI